MKYIAAFALCLPLGSCGIPINISIKDPASGVGGSYSPKGGLVIDVDIPIIDSGK